jgi:hypothetical protein
VKSSSVQTLPWVLTCMFKWFCNILHIIISKSVLTVLASHHGDTRDNFINLPFEAYPPHRIKTLHPFDLMDALRLVHGYL